VAFTSSLPLHDPMPRVGPYVDLRLRVREPRPHAVVLGRIATQVVDGAVEPRQNVALASPTPPKKSGPKDSRTTCSGIPWTRRLPALVARIGRGVVDEVGVKVYLPI
jgi:hypothetical protein